MRIEMASDAAPAAVPGTSSPDPTTPATPAPGPEQAPGLAGVLAPVTPARSAAFTLQPTDGTPDSTAAPAGHTTDAATSASFHGGENNPEDPAKNTSGTKQQTGVVRAWLLAGAERWKKGGDARLKALDIQKEKAKARQVKESVTVNRAEKIVGGSTNSSTGSNSGKSVDNKASKKDSTTGPKNSGGAAGKGPAGRPNTSGSGTANGAGRSGGRTPSGGGAGGSKNNGGPGSGNAGGDRKPRGNGNGNGTGKGDRLQKGNGNSPANTPKPVKDPAKPGAGTGERSGGKAGPTGPAGKPGKDTPRTPTGKDTGPGKSDKKPVDLGKKPSDTKTPTGKNDGATGPHPAKQDKNKKQTPPTPGTADTPKTGRATDHPKTKPAPATGPGTRTPGINTQPSRETGYRDGTRAAKVTAHVEAWRDGAKDGYRDTRETAGREKDRLDKAHADRKKAATEPAKDIPVTKPASSADYHPTAEPGATTGAGPSGPRPVPVDHIDATHIRLGDGAARTHISRGEVRTLRSFQDRLTHKTDRMTRVAETTRVLEQHATEQAKQVTQLLEHAKGVKGGSKLVAALTKLEEAATVQAGKAADIHKRAARAAEACKALAASTETRYGAIYKAVADSGEDAPAKLSYYQEMTHA
ncbi:hypothetical protein [Streptomyces sp. NPDC060001]|uniref:hypothetical protein n=1 Tax=Streptomyces sp. NPDC060001 TaxID=3347032 RepID=UPI0036A8733C